MKRQPKPAPVSEPPPGPTCAEKSILAEHPADTIACASEEPKHNLAKLQECPPPNESVAISPPEAGRMPVAESRHEAAAPMVDHPSVAPAVLKEADIRQAEALAQRDARITELEERLSCERRQSQQQIEQIQSTLKEQRVQVADLLSRTGALDQTLIEERAERASLMENLDDMSRKAHRSDELETALADARHREQNLLQQVSDTTRNASCISELEAHLAAERGAATQLVQQLTILEHIERRAHELESTLTNEREQAGACRKRSAEFEMLAARVPALEEALKQERARIAELDGILMAERETAALVVTQVKQLESAVQRVHDLDFALADERERSMQLMKRVTEAEHVADQSTRRFEDMARKLGEIAGLASQLGNGKR